MKRIALYLSVIAAVAFGVTSCVDSVFPKGTDPTVVKPGPDVNITVSNVTDYSFDVEIAPEGDALYFSYLVAQGKAQKLDSVALYQVKYSGIEQGTVKYDKDPESVKGAASIKLTVKTDPNTPYTVYAVAGGSEGAPGKIATKTVLTSDTEAPVIKEAVTDGNIVTISFDEDVEYTEGAEIFGKILYKAYLTQNPFKAKTVASDVKVEGNVVTFTFDEVVNPGAFYTVNFAEGTFKDVVGNPCAALESKITTAYDFDKNTFEYEGIVGNIANGPLGYEIAELPSTIVLPDYANTKFTVKVKEGVARIDCVKNPYTTTITHKTESGSMTEVVEMKKLTQYGGNFYDFWVMPAGTPEDGDDIKITVPKGAVRDWWGNVNDKDIVLGPITVINPFKVDIQVSDITYQGALGTFTPSSDKVAYYYDYTESADLSGGTDQEYCESVIAYYKKKYGSVYKDYGYASFEEFFLDNFTVTGATKYDTQGELDPETDYAFFAFAVNDDLTIGSELFKTEFKTDAKPASDPNYAANLGAYSFSCYSSKGAPLSGTFAVEEDVVNESYLVSFLGSSFTPVTGSGVTDRFSCAWNKENNTITMAANARSVLGAYWDFGVGEDCFISLGLFYMTSTADVTAIVLQPDSSGNLVSISPEVPAGDAFWIESDVWMSESLKCIGAYSSHIFFDGLNFTKQPDVTSARKLAKHHSLLSQRDFSKKSCNKNARRK